MIESLSIAAHAFVSRDVFHFYSDYIYNTTKQS